MKTIIIPIIMLIAAVSLPAPAETLHVPADYNTIQSAIDDANNGDTVLIAPGTYTGDGNRDIDFLGKAITVRGIDPNDPNIVANTVIDCNGTSDEPHRGFYFHSGEDANSVLSGLTITKGYECEHGDYLHGNGGGIYCEGAGPLINNCIISGNRADYGGAIGAYQSSARISACRLIGNEASYYGGGIDCWSGNIDIIGCVISQNSAVSGGGLSLGAAGDSLLRVHNCLITNNQSDYAAVYCSAGPAAGTGKYIFTNCTIADNVCTSTTSYPPVFFDIDQGVITNCIVWNNSPAKISADYAVVSHCDIQYGWPGEGNIDIDPRFASGGDYHLSHGSPCIDAGTNDPCGGLPAADIDGADRIIDGDGDAVAVVDMGAYEHNPAIPLLGVSLPSDLVFHYAQGYTIPEAKSLFIANAGGGILDWKIIEDCNWLTVYPSQGQSTNETKQVKISVEPVSLDLGAYNCSLQVASPNALNSPVTVEITLQVGRLLRVPEDFHNIQSAIDDANDYDTVLVADGVYTGHGNHDITIHGVPITVRSENGPENCIIDCNGSNQDPHRGFYCDNPKGGIGPIIDGFTITNGCADSGGALLCANASIKVNNCVFTKNSTTRRRRRGNGGAIYIFRCPSFELTNCVLMGNRAISGGAIWIWGGGEIVMSNCNITGNRAAGTGGAIILHRGTMTLKNCTLAQNSSPYAGITAFDWDFAALQIVNCILANEGDEIRPGDGSTIAIAFSDVEGGWEGEGNIDAEPCFIRPGYWADANDVNVVVEPNEPNAVWVDGDYRLLGDSPCIDAGEPNYVASPNETDLDGRPRVVDGDEDGLGRIDMGAYEYVPPIEAQIRIMPRVLNLRSRGRWVLCKITLPAGYNVGDIDRGSILLEGQIEPGRVFASERLQAAIAMFSRAELSAILQPGRVELLVTGRLKDGTEFEGTAGIRVIPADRRGRHPQEK